MATQEGNGNLTYLSNAHMGHSPKEITMGIWGGIKVTHIDAHQKNSLPGVQGDWNQQTGLPLYSLKVAPWTRVMSRHWGTAAMPRCAESINRHVPLEPSKAQRARKIHSNGQQEEKRLQVIMWQNPECDFGADHRWQIRLMPAALRAANGSWQE